MNYSTLVLGIIFIPVIGAFCLPWVAKFSGRLRNILSFVFILSSFILSLKLIPFVLSGKTILIQQPFALGLNFTLLADNLAVFMACISSLISAVIVLYSFSYVSHYENQNEYYCMVTLFLGSMMGLVFSANLILMYIFWEITAITSWRLIGFFRDKPYVLKADKAFLVTVFGSLIMLIGFISIYQQTGSFDLPVIKEVLKTQGNISNLVVALILVGILSKSATLPFHTWLPDAGVAPSPVTALLHAAVLVKIGVYVYARIFIVNITPDVLWHTLLPLIAGLSAIVSAGAALIETDLKRIIAYSTISQIGFIFFGLAIGNEIAVLGALLFILMHGLAKAGLFLCAGIVEQNTKTKDITKLGGLISTMPFTAIAFLACAFSVMGIPPFGGFFSKYLVFSGALASGRLWVVLIFLIGAFLTIIYLFRVFNMVFLGKVNVAGKEASPVMVASVVSLALLSLAAGFLIYYPYKFAQGAVGQMLGVIK
ncbi:MAG: NADH-quinone oxidoreductase subunit L [Candidatus Omnitrophica bacterium]|nr:NADH-quinone oxidoreductase subunit L [Candidatus Omnitrophota bacterium]